jgi:phosphatidate cytidylyltransferase
MTKVQTRVTIGAGLIAGVVGVLVVDVALAKWAAFPYAPAFWALLLGALLVGTNELFRMLRASGYPCRPIIGMIFVVLLVAAAFGETQPNPIRPWLYDRGLELYLLVIVALVFTTFLAEVIRVERAGVEAGPALAAVAWTLMAVLAVGLLGVFLAKIRFLRPYPAHEADPFDGFMYLLLALGVVKGSDIGAYAVGTALGRHKLVPRVSPKKTVEGLAGGLAAGMLAAVLIGCLWGRFGWGQMLFFGVIVSISGILGDLAESLMKRACGAKDSGRIPGFGGALDILDSMLGAAPVAYLVLVVLERGGVLTGAPAGG